jgi:hypothetical protein
MIKLERRQPGSGFMTFVLQSIALAGVFLCLSACASLDGKFTATERADLSGFADQTIALMQRSDNGLQEDDTVLVRQYLNPTDPTVTQSIELANKNERLLAAINQYSVNIASFDLAIASDAERITTYVDYIESFRARIIDEVGLPEGDFSRIVDNIQQQSNFLEAIQAAQPIVNTVGRYGQLLLSDYELALDQIVLNIDTAIEQDFEPSRAHAAYLAKQRDATLVSLGALYDREIAERIDLADEEIALINTLEILKQLDQALEPRHELYKATHRELDQVYVAALDDAMRSRLALLVWVRAHERMASGVVDEADWFSYKDIGVAALNLGTRFIK